GRVRVEVGRGEAQVLLVGHFDTVWPVGQIATMPVRRHDGRLYGPGSYDMKAGIAIALLASRILVETGRLPRHRITMLWTADEEIGRASSRGILAAEASRSRAVLDPEPALAGSVGQSARNWVQDD